MTTLTDTQVITASGGLVELGYAEIASLTVTTTQQSVTNGPITVVCDGSPVVIEISGMATVPQGNQLNLALYRDGSYINQYWLYRYNGYPTAVGDYPSLTRWYRDTPSAGTHTYEVKAFASNTSGTITINNNPSFQTRVSKIVQATQWPAVTTGTIICTSSTRPAAPFPGQKIYETDTKKELTYDGTSWTQPWNQPWGVIGIGTHDTGLQVPANTSFCSVTFTPVLNRYYQAFYTQRTIWTTAGTIGIFDSVAGGRIAEQYGAPDPVTLQRTKTFSSTVSRTLSIRTDGVQTPISGSYSGNERPAQLIVMDVGPA